MAAATLIRPTWLPAAVVLPVLIAGWCAWNRFGTPPRVAAVCVALPAAFAVVMAPWTLRNLAVTGHAIPTTLWVGPSLYDGLGPQATGASDMRFFDEDRLLDRMSEYDMDREYRRRAWAFAAEHPGRAAWLGVVKLWRYWRPDPSAEQFSSPAARLLVAGFYLPMLALAAAGAWVRRGDLWDPRAGGGADRRVQPGSRGLHRLAALPAAGRVPAVRALGGGAAGGAGTAGTGRTDGRAPR